MSKPTTDRAGITQALKALDAAGWKMHHVWDQEDSSPARTVHEAVEAVMAVDDAHVHVRREGYDTNNETGWVRFVLGNDPDEVICDSTVNLSDVLDALTDSWDA